ncbi:MAG: hypothetical protein M3345_01960, partial [Actinomycetota bacterium]|nr:hypothetical protein [Actinomycetota bacterium]
DSHVAVLWAHVNDAPPHPSGSIPGLASVDPVFDRALAKEPAQRQSSCGELASALTAAVRVESRPLPEIASPSSARGTEKLPTPRQWLVAAAALALLVGGATWFFLTRAATDPPRSSGAAFDRGVVIAGSDGIEERLPTQDDPLGISVHDGEVWVAESYAVERLTPDPKLYRLETRTAEVAVGDEGVWVLSYDGALARLDLDDGGGVDEVPLDARLDSIAVGGGFVWAASPDESALYRIHPRTLVVRRFTVARPPSQDQAPGAARSEVVFGYGSAWVAGNYFDEHITEVPVSGRIRRHSVTIQYDERLVRDDKRFQLAVGNKWVWFAANYFEALGGPFQWVDRESGEHRNEPPSSPTGRIAVMDLAIGDETVWVVSIQEEDQLLPVSTTLRCEQFKTVGLGCQVDPLSAPITLPGHVVDIAADGDRVWVAVAP